MTFEISASTSTPLITVNLSQGESIKMESGAMVYKSVSVELTGKANGGFFSAVGKSLLGGENFFTTTATAQDNNAVLAIAPRGIGNVEKLVVGDSHWFLNDGTFLASSSTVNYGVVRQKNLANALFANTGGFFILKTEGSGEILLNGFGDIIQIELDGNNELQIDNGHVVAWEESLSYNISRASGMFGFKTGEGFLNTFSGKGKILIQTRQLGAFAESLIPFMPTQRVNR